MNTINSLAILKVNWDNNKKDHIDNYLPFIVHLIKKIGYAKIEIDKISKDFELEYGIKLPLQPARTLLERAQKQGYIKREKNQIYYSPVFEKLIEDNFEEVRNEQNRKLSNLLYAFVEFSEKYEKVSLEKAEKILLNYLKQNDAKLLFLNHGNHIIPLIDEEISKTDNFIFYKFVVNVYEKDNNLFHSLIDVAVGHLLANAVYEDDFPMNMENLQENEYYLDVSIFFELIGANGKERQEVYKKFIKSLQDSGIKLFIFRHTYNELLNHLEKCLNWIDNPDYDVNKAPRTLINFKLYGYSKNDIDRLIVLLPTTLANLNIQIIDVPDYQKNMTYQIDENCLREKIIKYYKSNNRFFDEKLNDFILQNDIDSISAIYRLRKDHKPRNINEAKHIFITTNNTLAHAALRFHKDEFSIHTLCACFTDTFIGTLIWLNTPKAANLNNMSKLIADAYAAIQPDSATIRLYLSEIDKLNKEGTLTPEQYNILRTHTVVNTMLEEKILGDPEKYNDKTPEELIYELEMKYKIMGEEKYNEEKKNSQEYLNGLKEVAAERDNFKKELKNAYDLYSNLITVLSNILAWAIFIITFFILLYLFLKDNSATSKIVIGTISFISLIFGSNIFHIKKWSQNRILSYLLNKLPKHNL